MSKVWFVEAYDYCEGWVNLGFFSTKDNAEAYKSAVVKDEVYESDDVRVDWGSLDEEYVA